VAAAALCELIAASARMLCSSGLAVTPAAAAYEAVFMNWRREWSIFRIVDKLLSAGQCTQMKRRLEKWRFGRAPEARY
jgi:hypothetical protein